MSISLPSYGRAVSAHGSALRWRWRAARRHRAWRRGPRPPTDAATRRTMQLIHPTAAQAATIAEAMHAVVSAEGTIAPLPIEEDSIAAIQIHLLQQRAPLQPRERTLPSDLAETLDDPTLRRATIRILALLPVID